MPERSWHVRMWQLALESRVMLELVIGACGNYSNPRVPIPSLRSLAACFKLASCFFLLAVACHDPSCSSSHIRR